MLNLIGEAIQEGAENAAKKTAKNAVLDNMDDLSKASLRNILKMSGKTPETTVEGVRNAVIDTLSDPKIDKRLRTEVYNRTPFAARVWNNSNRVNETPKYPMFRSNAFQSGIDMDNIIKQYADSEGGMSTITLSDLDKAFGGNEPVFSALGDLYSPYADEGAARTLEWAKNDFQKPVTRQQVRDKYWGPIVEGIDRPENVLEKRMSDIDGYREGFAERYDEYLAAARPDEAITGTRKDFMPSSDPYDYSFGDDVSPAFRDMLLDRFTQRAGKGRSILERSIPGLAMLLGGGALLGSNKKEKE